MLFDFYLCFVVICGLIMCLLDCWNVCYCSVTCFNLVVTVAVRCFIVIISL